MLAHRNDLSDRPKPLTHHEILALIAPFTRRGHHADLAASNRLERRVAFKPVEHTIAAAAVAVAAGDGALRETLTLENPLPGSYRLTRVLTTSGGVATSLEAAGPDPAELLACVEAVPAELHFQNGPGYRLARSFSIEPWAPAARGSDAKHLRLTRGVIALEDLTATVTVASVNGIPATIELIATGEALTLPQDLIAVLGRDWTPLRVVANGWKAEIKLRGRGAAYSRDAEAKLERTARHLAGTLAEPPVRFHERLVVSRWAVVFRRTLPLQVSIALIAGAAAVPHLHLSEMSVLRMLIFNSPPLLLMAAFCMGDLPRFEIPSWPRPLRAASWREPPPDALRLG
jgi:hypothetical protein